MPFAHAHSSAETVHLLWGQEAGMVVLMASQRQAESLDRVAQEQGRPIMGGGLLERVQQSGQIMAAQIAHQLSQLFVRAALDQR